MYVCAESRPKYSNYANAIGKQDVKQCAQSDECVQSDECAQSYLCAQSDECVQSYECSVIDHSAFTHVHVFIYLFYIGHL